LPQTKTFDITVAGLSEVAMNLLLPLVLAVAAAELKPVDIARRAGPAVVTIKTSGPEGAASGSGFIVDPSGTVVTNLHVIEGASTIAVRLPNGDVYDNVRVRAFDARKDLAVLQVPGYNLPTVELGDSDSAEAGQQIVLIGNPLGMLAGSVSSGIVSGVRVLEEAGFRVIQTDAAANPGNSGGPMFDMSGHVLGVLSFKLRGTENLNFVVPINYARGLLASNESFNLEELATRLSARSADLFSSTKRAAQTRWRSLASGNTKIIRVDGDHLYVETVTNETDSPVPIIEFTKEGDSYVGAIRDRRTCYVTDWMNQTHMNVCNMQTEIQITLFSPTRIEGWLMEPSGSFNCSQCTTRRSRTDFVWIPE
jgi:hypothetical protein